VKQTLVKQTLISNQNVHSSYIGFSSAPFTPKRDQ
jgi:hypothetical protein